MHNLSAPVREVRAGRVPSDGRPVPIQVETCRLKSETSAALLEIRHWTNDGERFTNRAFPARQLAVGCSARLRCQAPPTDAPTRTSSGAAPPHP
jgi:hypothetical protein